MTTRPGPPTACAGTRFHGIDTTSRDAYYWLAVLFTFALSTAAGDLVSERMNLGYWLAGVLFALAIGAVAVAHFALGLDAVRSFWIAYRMHHPLVGRMRLNLQTLNVPQEKGQRIVVVATADAGTASETALRLLAQAVTSTAHQKDHTEAAGITRG